MRFVRSHTGTGMLSIAEGCYGRQFITSQIQSHEPARTQDIRSLCHVSVRISSHYRSIDHTQSQCGTETHTHTKENSKKDIIAATRLRP